MSAAVSTKRRSTAPGPPPFKDMIWIPGGEFLMGSDHHYPEEAPVHRVSVDGFWIDAYPVANYKFQKFAKQTSYVTVAERTPKAEDYPGAIPEMLVSGSVVFTQPSGRVDLSNHYNWWNWVPGADWRHPEGPESNLNGLDRHPVVHLALEDVEAYTAWAGKELPAEAEWEYAARGGLDGAEYAWGSELTPKGKEMANTWQGEFPWQNLLLDGYARTSPVGAFPPNGYGLFDMIGNVWEWTTDWYLDHHTVANGCCGDVSPATAEASVDPRAGDIQIPRRVIKGGSFICAPNYCRRYRPAARMHHTIDTGTNHLGFRNIVRVPANGGVG